MKTKLELIRMLSEDPLNETELEEAEEERQILQPDGSRACINHELRGKGYHLVHERDLGCEAYTHVWLRGKE